MSEAQDVTVLRTDTSISRTGNARGSGEADPPRVLKQRFVLEEKLGSGGMGTVFRAKDLRKVEARDRQPFVAVKVLNNDFREHPEAFIALQREAVKSQALSHPSIVSIFDFDKDGDVPFIIMELLEGQELAELLRAYPTGLPDEMAWNIIRCLCAGLEHAHEAGVVHADFKPGNVFISPDNKAKILDFGIARAVHLNHGEEDDPEFDPARLAALTPAYASQEMLSGHNPERRDDLYSLGVVIYLILTGQHPYGRIPANQAARENLKPERPGRLSRRQWRIIERCLAFDRQDRPESVTEVAQHLLHPAPWRSRTALVAVLAVLTTLGVTYLKEGAAVTEAKEEVRQITLVDSQMARLGALLASPRFDVSWHDQLREEAENMQSLEGAEALSADISRRVRELYATQIALSDTDTGIQLFERASFFGPMPDTADLLSERLAARVVALLNEPVLGVEWLQQVASALAQFAQLQPASTALAELEMEFADVLALQLIQSVEAGRFPAARMALAFLQERSFDPEILEDLDRQVQAAEARQVAQDNRQQRTVTRNEFRAELTAALDGPCLDLDLSQGAAVYRRWLARYPGFAAVAEEVLVARLGRCLNQLAAVDADRAHALRTDAQKAFGVTPGLAETIEDPCAAPYLVGNGGQPGRAGYCADRLADQNAGPRLVVLPAPDGQGQFAISKHEISWSEFNRFCIETAGCEPQPTDQMPVTGIDLDLAKLYARWLSEQTGHVYRLPTRQEWLHAAQGDPDPNRNCQVQLGSVRRGLAPVAVESGVPSVYGLMNALGNVQEWVLEAGEAQAAGGAYSDPIQDCVVQTVRPHQGQADATTGFRLVREVS
jgi:hypothetical protein